MVEPLGGPFEKFVDWRQCAAVMPPSVASPRTFETTLVYNPYKCNGHKEEEVPGWRKFQNEELRNSYSSPNIIGMVRSRGWAGHVTRMEATGNACRILVRKSEGRTPLERLRVRWRDNIWMLEP
jgi:hypothetical protein